jgi:ABC-type nitrate/sulfonate/bicarbonate transport system substrate-binding protein
LVVWVVGALAAVHPAIPWAQQPRQVTVALSSSSLGASGARVASEMGLFARRDLAPRFTVMDSSSNALAALIAGSVNFAVAGTPELIIAHAHGQMQPVAIATSATLLPASLVLAKSVADKSGVAPAALAGDRLKALNGLVIATPSAVTIGTVTVGRAAAAVGAKIRWTYINQPAMQSALESGAVQGFLSASPYWVFPVIKNEGIVWLSGPKGDIPAELAPAISSVLITIRGYAAANRALVKNMAEVFDDFATAVEDRPADVKAAIARLYPDLGAHMIDILFDSESHMWRGRQATPQAMAREIALVRASGIPLPPTEQIDPASLLYP